MEGVLKISKFKKFLNFVIRHRRLGHYTAVLKLSSEYSVRKNSAISSLISNYLVGNDVSVTLLLGSDLTSGLTHNLLWDV